MSQFSLRIELIPGKLTVQVVHHNLTTLQGQLPCWSYVTDGLRAHRQNELIFTLRCKATEKPRDFPPDPLDFFRAVYSFAERGQLAHVGQYSELAPPGLFGRGDLTGLVYAAPQFPSGLQTHARMMSAILLTASELEVCKRFGVTRMLAILGQAYSYYPCPPWADRERPSLASPDEMQAKSILAKGIPLLRLPGAQFRLENRFRLVLRLLETSWQHLPGVFKQLRSNGPLAFLTEPDPKAVACLIWKPGQIEVQAIAAPDSGGSRVTGNFVMLCGEQAEDRLQMVEDGFLLWLTDATWDGLRQALETGQPFTTSLAQIGAPPVAFALEWAREFYHSPVDGRVYFAQGGWYSAGHPDPSSPQKLVQPGIILLNTDDELYARITVEGLSNYTTQVVKSVEDQFGRAEEKPGQELVVQFEIGPQGNACIEMVSRPGLDQPRLDTLLERLKTIPVPPVKERSVLFQIYFRLWGGSGEPLAL